MKDKEKDENVIRNFHIKSKEIERLYYFIDLPVIGHVLGVLWILRCGYLLDDKLYKNCYGNRLNKYLLEKLKNKNSDYYLKDDCYDFSPFLFKPYFKNYESWRDDGLDSVNNLLENKKNVIMFSMDLKEFYYRSLVNFDNLRIDIKDTRNYINKKHDFTMESEEHGHNIKIDNKLTEFIEKVFCCYSSNFTRNYSLKELTDKNDKNKNTEKEIDVKNHPMIPLGFLPSLIISNWYLQGFDQAIIESVHPHYYGRYVDDILIVIGSHEKSESHGNQMIEEDSSEYLLDKYLTIGEDDPKVSIFSKEDINKKEFRYRIYNQSFKNSKNHEIKYNYSGLEIQSNKLKTYYFSHNHSNAMIENFKNEIIKNSSEFRLMHDLDSIQKDFKKNLYKIDYEESINKLGDIKKVGINKFEISKILSRINWISSDTNDNIDDEVIYNVLGAFKEKIFEYITLWEKLFILLLTNKKYKELTELIIFIQKRISNLEVTTKQQSYTYRTKNEKDITIVEKSLQKFLYSTIIRIFSLKNNFKINQIKETITLGFKFDEEPHFREDICNCLRASMQNNSFMKYPLEDLTDTITNIETRKIYSYDLIKRKNRFAPLFKGFCYPRFIKLHELILHFINNEIFKNESTEYISLSFDKFQELNFDSQNITKYNHIKDECELECFNSTHCPLNIYGEKQFKELKVIKTVGKQKESLKVGLLNTKLEFDDFKNRILENPNLTSDRFDKIKKLINESISKEVDLLVMPEMYIPYEWIEKIVKISKDHQIAMIFGVEPFEKDKIGNYIMMTLPFIFNEKYLECGLIYRLKNHYAPAELREFKKYDKEIKEVNNEINKYYMCIWNGIHIVPYYCYEIASLDDRSVFKSCCDIVTVSEFNKDTKYFNSIAESLSRDLYCYCIKSNTSEFGGSCIIQPTQSESKYIINLKGGEDDYIVTHELDIKKLRENAITSDEIENKTNFKPKPPSFCRENVWVRMNNQSKVQ